MHAQLNENFDKQAALQKKVYNHLNLKENVLNE